MFVSGAVTAWQCGGCWVRGPAGQGASVVVVGKVVFSFVIVCVSGRGFARASVRER